MDRGFDVVVNIITLGCGIYALYTWFKLLAGKLFDNSLVMPRERTAAQCLDEETYVAYIRPRTLILGIATVISGGTGVVDSYTGIIRNWAQTQDWLGFLVEFGALILVPLAVIIWYGVCLVRAHRRYWP